MFSCRQRRTLSSSALCDLQSRNAHRIETSTKSVSGYAARRTVHSAFQALLKQCVSTAALHPLFGFAQGCCRFLAHPCKLEPLRILRGLEGKGCGVPALADECLVLAIQMLSLLFCSPSIVTEPGVWLCTSVCVCVWCAHDAEQLSLDAGEVSAVEPSCRLFILRVCV